MNLFDQEKQPRYVAFAHCFTYPMCVRIVLITLLFYCYKRKSCLGVQQKGIVVRLINYLHIRMLAASASLHDSAMMAIWFIGIYKVLCIYTQENWAISMCRLGMYETKNNSCISCLYMILVQRITLME